jgi:hypothetical protein
MMKNNWHHVTLNEKDFERLKNQTDKSPKIQSDGAIKACNE